MKIADVAIACCVAITVAIAVAPVTSHREFVLDSEYVVRDNPRVREGRFGEILRSTWWNDDDERSVSLYRPLTMTWLAAIATMTHDEGEDLAPRPFARGNVFLHALVGALRYSLLLLLLASFPRRRLLAAAAAILAGVHGIAAESVVGIVGAAELLAAAFVTLSWIAVAVATRSRGPRAWGAAVLAALCWAAALAAKESAAFFPAVVLAHGLIFAAGGPAARMKATLAVLAPFALAGAAWLVQRHGVTGDWLPAGEGVWGGFEDMERIASALAATVTVYARGVVWPFDLAPNITHQDVAPAAGLADGRALAGLALWGVVLLGTGAALARRSVVGLLALFGVVSFLPTSNLVVGIGAVAANRFFYAPLFAVAAAVVIGADALGRRRGGAGIAAWALIAALGIVGLTGARRLIDDWQTSESLYAAAADANPRCVWALQNLVLARHFSRGVPTPQAADAAIADSLRFDAVEDELAVIPSTGRLDLATRVHAYKLLYNRAGLWSQVAQGATTLKRRVEASTRAADDLTRAERYAWDRPQAFEARLTLFNMRLLELQNASADAEEREILLERVAFALDGARVLVDDELPRSERVKFHVAEADLATVRGDGALASRCLEEALSVDPHDPDLRRQLAERALQRRRVGDALEHLDAAIAGGRAPMMTYLMAAEIAGQSRDAARCRRYLEAGLEVSVTQPGEWEVRRRMASMLEQIR